MQWPVGSWNRLHWSAMDPLIGVGELVVWCSEWVGHPPELGFVADVKAVGSQDREL